MKRRDFLTRRFNMQRDAEWRLPAAEALSGASESRDGHGSKGGLS